MPIAVSICNTIILFGMISRFNIARIYISSYFFFPFGFFYSFLSKADKKTICIQNASVVTHSKILFGCSLDDVHIYHANGEKNLKMAGGAWSELLITQTETPTHLHKKKTVSRCEKSDIKNLSTCYLQI